MATTEHANEPAPVDEVAASLRNAGLVRLVGAPRGDALAATGLLANALEAVGVPYHAGLRRDAGAGSTEADVTVAVGLRDAAVSHMIAPDEAGPVAGTLDRPDPVLAVIAGAGRSVDDAALHRRAGLAVPTTDCVDGLAHSTLVHGPFSGDIDATREVLGAHAEGTDAAARRKRASAVALSVGATAPPASRAGTAIERVLRPHAGGPLETVEGYGDVLDALARRDSGLGLAAVLGGLDAEAALSTWRDYAREIHDVVSAATLRRHHGLAVAEASVSQAAVKPVARLLRDFRSPEPAVLVVGPDRTALATSNDRPARALLDEHAPATGHAGVASARSDTADLERALATELEGDG